MVMKRLLLGLLFCGFGLNAHALRIGIEGAYPPFSSVDENNNLVGFDVEMAEALCAEMSRSCELVKIDWDGLIPSLLNENIDAIVASMSSTEERKKIVAFTDKYYGNKGRMVVHKEELDKITEDNWQDYLRGKRVGVQTSTIHDQYLSDNFADVVAKIDRYNTQDEANFDLVAGRIDLTIADQAALATGFLQSPLGADFAFASPVFDAPEFYGEGVAIAVRQGDDQLREDFNQAILNIRENGVYQKINDKYFDFDIY